MKNRCVVLTSIASLFLSAMFFMFSISEANENKLKFQTGPGTLAYAISSDGCLVWIIRTEINNGYREVLINLNGRHCAGSDIPKEDMNKGAMFLLSADFYKDYNEGVDVGKPIIIGEPNKMEKLKVFIVTDPFAKNITGESKFLTISELSSAPCGFKKFRYGLSTDNELILILEEGNTVSVFRDSNGRHILDRKTQLQDISKGNYQLIKAVRTPTGKIKLGEKLETVKFSAEQSLKPKVHEKDQTQLPHFKKPLVGPNEVRVKNPNHFDVKVGLRDGDRGKNFEVAANGMASVFVPNGAYKIYFIYSNKPGALFQGNDFSLNNNGIEIQIVKVVGGNYGIRQIK